MDQKFERSGMLILSRRPGEAITIGDSVCMRVLEVKGGQVKLGIEAPSDVNVLRTELKDRMGANEGGHTAR